MQFFGLKGSQRAGQAFKNSWFHDIFSIYLFNVPDITHLKCYIKQLMDIIPDWVRCFLCKFDLPGINPVWVCFTFFVVEGQVERSVAHIY